jgi:hypothetical protein
MLESAGYMLRFVRALGWQLPRPGRRAVLLGILCAVLAGSAGVYGGEGSRGESNAAHPTLEERVRTLGSLLGGVESLYEDEVAPLERVLLDYRSDDPRLVRRIAVSLLREARRTELEPRLLLAVLLVENPWLDPEARSFMGAQGLMQVMPFHKGKWEPCEPRLDDIDANICHGASIFAAYLKQSNGDVERALLRYNGCVRGTNTPNCHQYPNHVFARAGRATILAWRNNATASATP